MAKPTKALRGKHRWIGISVQGDQKRDDLNAQISEVLIGIKFKLFDCLISDSMTRGIIKVSINDYEDARGLISSHKKIESISSSGKIKLVRQRMNIEKPSRKK